MVTPLRQLLVGQLGQLAVQRVLHEVQSGMALQELLRVVARVRVQVFGLSLLVALCQLDGGGGNLPLQVVHVDLLPVRGQEILDGFLDRGLALGSRLSLLVAFRSFLLVIGRLRFWNKRLRFAAIFVYGLSSSGKTLFSLWSILCGSIFGLTIRYTSFSPFPQVERAQLRAQLPPKFLQFNFRFEILPTTYFSQHKYQTGLFQCLKFEITRFVFKTPAYFLPFVL